MYEKLDRAGKAVQWPRGRKSLEGPWERKKAQETAVDNQGRWHEARMERGQGPHKALLRTSDFTPSGAGQPVEALGWERNMIRLAS